jgi:hypothetical protein
VERSCTAVVVGLAFLASAGAQAAPAASTRASLVLNTNFDSQSCGPSDNSATGGSISSGCSRTDSTFGTASTATVLATAAPGVLRAVVNASITSRYADTRLVNWNTAANGGVSAAQRDSLTITGGSGSGQLVAQFVVHGSAWASVIGTAQPNPQSTFNDSFANYVYSGVLKLGSDTFSYGGSGNADINVPTPPVSTQPQVVTLTTAFTFGAPIDVFASIAMSWSVDARRVVLYSPSGVFVGFGDTVSSVNGAFGDTIYWGGISSVTDSNGVAVAYSVVSESGLDYRNAAVVPEAPRAAALLLGLLGLGGRVGRTLRHRSRLG